MEISEAAAHMAREQAIASQMRGGDDLNDVRLAIGALSNSHRELRGQLERVVEGLDDLGALMSRMAALSELLDDVEAFGARVPALLRDLANDPMIGMFAAGPANQLADTFEAHMAERAKLRANPPAIEAQ